MKKMQEEIWKDVPNYEGLYQVSNLGNVRSLNRMIKNGTRVMSVKGKLLKPQKNTHGYLSVSLSINGKTKTTSIHSLVAKTFLNHDWSKTKLDVDHIDNNKLNNFLSNLQLITHRENSSKDTKGSSNYTGVRWYEPRNKWRSTIQLNSKNKHLGYFDCEFKAHLAYQKALKEIL